MVEIERDRQNHLVARVGDCENRVHEGHVAAGRDHHAKSVPRIDAVLATQFVFDRTDQRAIAGAVLVGMRLGVRERRPGRLQCRRRRAVVHDPLPQRNGARMLPDHVADNGDDGGLDGVHP